MTTVTHSPRVAWDLARATVAMAGAAAEKYGWFAGQLEQRLGIAARHELEQTRVRLIRDERLDVYQVELGRWRVRLEDALAVDPSLGSGLVQLRADATVRLISGG
jgi:hypothetical protein